MKFPQQHHDHVTYEDPTRCLVSPAFGCASYCTYCYLPSLGFSLGQEPATPSSSGSIIESIENNTSFTKGPRGTCISLGCFTECLSPGLIGISTDIINHFLRLGNPVTISTKQDPITLIDYCAKHIQRDGQFGVFLSCPTISGWLQKEKDTSPPTTRISRIGLLKDAGIASALYIKPFLGLATAHDLLLYADIISRYDIPAVVGTRFVMRTHGSPAPIASATLKIAHTNGYSEFYKSLSSHGKVFERSIDVISAWHQT